MATHSKMQFQTVLWALSECTCSDIFHPWTKYCSLGVLNTVLNAVPGACKFFSVIYVLQLLVKIQKRKADRAYLRTHLEGFFWSVVFGSSIAGCFVATSCSLRALFGRYFQYTAVFIPALVATASSVFLERPFKRNLYAYTFFQMFLEYLVLRLEASGIGPLHPDYETLLFMAINGVLLYLIRTDKSNKPTYWFFLPKNGDPTDENTVPRENASRKLCSHSDTCTKNILKSVLQYGSVGVGIQLFRGIISKFSALRRTPSMALIAILCNKNILRLGAFLGLYIGVFKLILCILCRTCDGEADSHTLIAGFVAGCAYRLNPERALPFSGATTLMQLLLRRAKSKGIMPDLPLMPELIFALCCSMLFQVRFLENENCPRFVTKTLSTITNGRTEYYFKNFQTISAAYLRKLQT